MYSFSNASSPLRSDYADSSSTRGSYSLWEPEDVLQVYNEAHGGALTCVGHAPSMGRRCRNPIAQSNQDTAELIMDQLAELDPNSKAVKPLLRDLARRTLCLRNHQNQADEVTRKWLTAIADHSRRHNAHRVPKSERMANPEPGRHTVPTGSATIDAETLKTVQNLVTSLKSLQADLKDALAGEAQERRAKEKLQAKMARDAAERRDKEEREAAAAWEVEQRREERKRQKKAEKQRREREEAERLRKAAEEAEHLRKAAEEAERRRKAAEEAERQRQEAEQQRERERMRREEQETRRREAERLEKQRSEQEQAWKLYNLAWEEFDELRSEGRATVNGLRWPVKFGTIINTNESAVREFYRVVLDGKTALEKKKLMRREMFRWHPDRLSLFQPKGVVKAMIDMVARVVLEFRSDVA